MRANLSELLLLKTHFLMNKPSNLILKKYVNFAETWPSGAASYCFWPNANEKRDQCLPAFQLWVIVIDRNSICRWVGIFEDFLRPTLSRELRGERALFDRQECLWMCPSFLMSTAEAFSCLHEFLSTESNALFRANPNSLACSVFLIESL